MVDTNEDDTQKDDLTSSAVWIVQWLRLHRVLVLFLIVTALFTFLAYLNEQRVRDVKHLYELREATNYQGCLQGNISAARFNTLLETLAKIDQNNPVLTPEVRAQRVNAYRQAKISLYNCQDFARPPTLPIIPTGSASPTPSRS